MLASSLISGTCCAMSHHDPLSPKRKNLPQNLSPNLSKSPVTSQSDSNDKLKKVLLPTYTQMIGRVDDQLKLQSSDHPRVQSRSDNGFDEEDSMITCRQRSCTSTQDKKWSSYAPLQEETNTMEESNFDDKEFDLIGMLTRQLYLAENQIQSMQSVLKKAEDRLKTKDQEIGRLKRKIKDWEAKNGNQELIHKKEMQQKKTQIENSEYLYRRCLKLEHTIYEMEKFFADYGLVWVGDSKTVSKKNSSSIIPNDFIKNCYEQLTANIAELNMTVGKGEVHVERNQDGGGASFKTPACVCLKFYKNGMVIGNGRLRLYSDAKTGSFIRDILDGYFPSELQRAYPNGVPFKVEDHRTKTYLGRGVGFPGQGYRLGKQPIVRPRSSTVTAQSPRYSSHVSENHRLCSNIKIGQPSVPTSARSSRQSVCSRAQSIDLLDLRSQILASHNNNCSDSHLQSHINAELGYTSRSDTKRTAATKTTEYQMSMQYQSLSSRNLRPNLACLSSRSRTTQHDSIDRLNLRSSPSRLVTSSSGISSRPRSSSLNSGRYPFNSLSSLSTSGRTDSPTRNSHNCTTNIRTTKPRITRSATLDRKQQLPFVREINKATGRPGELRLKIRSMNGCTVFLIHVSADDTVATLYQLLDSAMTMPKGLSRSYRICISGYERKRLDQFAISLREYGISRDSVLHLIND